MLLPDPTVSARLVASVSDQAATRPPHPTPGNEPDSRKTTCTDRSAMTAYPPDQRRADPPPLPLRQHFNGAEHLHLNEPWSAVGTSYHCRPVSGTR